MRGLVHRYRDRVLLKLVSVCAVYCRFCFRRETVGPGGAGLDGRDFAAALDYVARASGDLGGRADRRRSAGAVAAPIAEATRALARPACEGAALAYAAAGRRAGARHAGAGARARAGTTRPSMSPCTPITRAN